MTTKKPFDAQAWIKEFGAEIEKLNRYESAHEKSIQALERRINQVLSKNDGIQARYVFVWATVVGISGGFCVNRLAELDGGWTHLGALAVTLVGGAVFAALSAAWLGAYTSMGE